jgi:hypothetical protein
VKPAIIVACFTLALSQQLAAQSKRASTGWAKEPATVFGLQFDEKLGDGDLEDCGGVKASTSPPKLSFCRMSGYADHILIAGFPIDEFEGGSLIRSDGVVEGLLIKAKQRNYPAIKRILIERYGPPTKQSVGRVQNLAGASFTAETAMWVGRRLTLTLEERAGNVDDTVVFFNSNAALLRAASERDKKTKQGASKL